MPLRPGILACCGLKTKSSPPAIIGTTRTTGFDRQDANLARCYNRRISRLFQTTYHSPRLSTERDMTLLYYDPCFLEHETGNHPEKPDRLRRIVSHLEETKLLETCRRPAWENATAAQLARVHELEYIARLKKYAADGGGRIESDTVVSPRSHEVAVRAAGAACDAVTRVVKGEEQRALCLIRPPGHHALANDAMGFCLLNNVAVAARVATADLEIPRVLIVDWDVHHGNGTQDAFWTDERVGFFSAHRFPFYPGSGAKDEIGAGPGLGTTRNLPLEFGTTRDQYHRAFEAELTTFADRIKPGLVLVSAGFDAHRLDPIGSLGLEEEDFERLTRVVLDIARTHASGRVVSLLEGGYNLDTLPGCVATHLRALRSI